MNDESDAVVVHTPFYPSNNQLPRRPSWYLPRVAFVVLSSAHPFCQPSSATFRGTKSLKTAAAYTMGRKQVLYVICCLPRLYENGCFHKPSARVASGELICESKQWCILTPDSIADASHTTNLETGSPQPASRQSSPGLPASGRRPSSLVLQRWTSGRHSSAIKCRKWMALVSGRLLVLAAKAKALLA